MANRQIANRLIRQVSEMSVRFSPIIPMNLTVTENNNCCHPRDSVHRHQSLTRTRSCDCDCKVRAKLSFSCHMAVIVYIFCAVGCLYQVYEVSDMYFKYKTVTNLRIFRPKNIVPPAVSICFPYLQLINFTLAFEKYPEMDTFAHNIVAHLNETIDFSQKQMLVFKNSEGDFDQIFSRYLQENYTVGQILSVTKDIQNILMRCVITDPEDYTVIQSSSFQECSKVWNIDDYVKDESKCFRFRFKRTTNRTQPEIYKLEQLSSKFAWRSLLMQVRLNIDTLGEKMERMFLYLHSHDKYPTGRTDSVLEFRTPTDVNSTYTITYSRVWNRLLDHPYDSNCKYYPVNRGHEVDQCIIKASMANYGRVPFTLLFQSDSDLKVFGFLAIMGNKTLENELRDLIHECMFEFEHLDCESEVFKAEMLHKHIGGNNLKIEVSIPSAQDIENELHKKQDVLEYFIYNGSVLGFWFGFCVSKLVKAFVLLEKLFSKKPRPRRANIETTPQNSFD